MQSVVAPALLIIPLVHFVGRKIEHPKVKTVLRAVIIASAGLLLAAAIPLGREGLTGPVTIGIAVGFMLLLTTKLDTLWTILGAALVSLTANNHTRAAYPMPEPYRRDARLLNGFNHGYQDHEHCKEFIRSELLDFAPRRRGKCHSASSSGARA